MPNPPAERRGAPRITTRIEVAYEDAGRQVFLATRDLSETGIYLLAPDAPGLGVDARVFLQLPGHPRMLHLAGRVARREGAGFAVEFDPGRLAPETRGTLRGFVEHG